MQSSHQIEQRLNAWKPKFLGRHRLEDLTKLVESCFKPWHVRAKIQQDPELGWQESAISGLFDSQLRRKNIDIIVHVGWGGAWFSITEKTWASFKFDLGQVLQHELIHRRQASYRTHIDDEYSLYYDVKAGAGADKQNMDYLAEFDEIEAYAHDIALEIQHYYPRQDPFKILATLNRRRRVWSWNYYKRTFKGSDDWSEVRNRLLKKTYLWLTNPHKE
jgi:hypothetical protein